MRAPSSPSIEAPMNPESIFYSVVNGDLPPSQAGTLLG